jgi:hypothetical protein
MRNFDFAWRSSPITWSTDLRRTALFPRVFRKKELKQKEQL